MANVADLEIALPCETAKLKAQGLRFSTGRNADHFFNVHPIFWRNLKREELRIHADPYADGNCFFAAVVKCLKLDNATDNTWNHKRLRARVVERIE